MKTQKFEHNIDIRVSLLQQTTAQISETLKEIKLEMRELKSEMNGRFDKIQTKVDKVESRCYQILFLLVSTIIVSVFANTFHVI